LGEFVSRTVHNSVQIGSALCDAHAVDVAPNVKCLQLLYEFSLETFVHSTGLTLWPWNWTFK